MKLDQRLSMAGGFFAKLGAPTLHPIFFTKIKNEINVKRSGSETDPGSVKGTALRILKYPHPKLRQDNTEITEFDESLRATASEMLLVMV